MKSIYSAIYLMIAIRFLREIVRRVLTPAAGSISSYTLCLFDLTGTAIPMAECRDWNVAHLLASELNSVRQFPVIGTFGIRPHKDAPKKYIVHHLASHPVWILNNSIQSSQHSAPLKNLLLLALCKTGMKP